MNAATELTAPPRPYPLYVVTGPRGSGKTSLINALLALRPSHERWAILLNEEGHTQVDLTAAGGQVTVKDAAGACACCTGLVVFVSTLAALIRQTRPDRVFVEADAQAALEPLLSSVRTSFNGSVALERVIALSTRSLPEGHDDPGYLSFADWPDSPALKGILAAPSPTSHQTPPVR